MLLARHGSRHLNACSTPEQPPAILRCVPFYLLAAALIVVWVAALLASGGFLIIAGGVGLGVSARRSRAGRRAPQGLRPVSVVGIILGALMLLAGLGIATFNVAAFLSTAA